MSAAWRSEPERGSLAAYAVMSTIARTLGRTLTRPLLGPACLYYLATAPRARRASRAFLARALGRPAGTLDVLRHYHSYASTLLDRVYFATGRHDVLDLSLTGEEPVGRLLARGHGCLLVGSHLGSFEALRAAGRMRGRKVSVLMHEENAATMRQAFARLAPELQARVIQSGRIDTMLRVHERLEQGEIVGILADRPLGGDRAHSAPFLGAPARFPLGPWLLAGALGAPIVLCYGLYRGGARYDVRFEVLSEGERVPRAAREAAALGWLRRYVASLESHAREAPYNWFNFYDFWDAQAG